MLETGILSVHNMFWFPEAGRGACVHVHFRRGINIQSSHAFKTVLKTHLYTHNIKVISNSVFLPPPPLYCVPVCVRTCVQAGRCGV